MPPGGGEARDLFPANKVAQRHTFGAPSCPLAGCRAPECAAEELLHILSELFDEGRGRVILELCPGLPEDKKTLLVEEYERGRNHLFMYVSLKVGPWGQLPLKLVGVGHYNEQTARTCARKALQLSEAYGDNYDHHAVSLMMCVGEGLEQLQAFVDGARRADLPLVQFWAARFMTICVNERWVEGLHARMHKTALIRRADILV